MLLGEDYWKSIKSEPAEWEQFFGAPDLGDFERRGVRLKWSRPGWSGWQIFLKIGQVGLSTTLCAATIIKSKGNIGKITQDIMDTETPCRAWLKGDCWKHRKGSCDLAHIKKFCQNGIECKDKTCLEGFQKRHVIKCSKRQRWKNGDECQFPRKWKSCSFFHPELGKVKVKEKECKKYNKQAVAELCQAQV